MTRRNFLCILFSFACLLTYGQSRDANFIVDYSQGLICGMDEESFASIEHDWYKDNPVISAKLIEGMMVGLKGVIIYNKNSANKVIVTVRSITENGKFNCDVNYVDSLGDTVMKIIGITCSKGGTIGTKLHLMKEGAPKEGENIGTAIRKSIVRNNK